MQTNETPKPVWLRVSVVAGLLDASTSQVKLLIKGGKLTATRNTDNPRSMFLVDAASVDAFLAAREKRVAVAEPIAA